jgi:hypothetical protein
MRISDLIKKLEVLKAELGDLEVLAPAREDGLFEFMSNNRSQIVTGLRSRP